MPNLKKPVKRKERLGLDDKIYYQAVNIVLALLLISVAYPLIFVVSASLSSPGAVAAGRVLLLPVEFSLKGYETVFKDPRIITGYANSIFYTVVGTAISVAITVIAAYPLSRREMPFRNGLMMLFTFTMLFGGGMIPNYILVRDLGMLNTRWSMLIPGALGVYNMIITRTFFQANIPNELYEAAVLDGCNDFKFFGRIVIPLSGAIIAVITLFYSLGQWNAFFGPLLYLTDKKLIPLSIILRDILLANSIDPATVYDPDTQTAMIGLSDLLRYSLIIVASLPMIMIYPFVQKYFVKGVMIGAVKG